MDCIKDLDCVDDDNDFIHWDDIIDNLMMIVVQQTKTDNQRGGNTS